MDLIPSESSTFDYKIIVSLSVLIPLYFIFPHIISIIKSKKKIKPEDVLIFLSFIIAVISNLITVFIIPEIARMNKKSGLFGKDLMKVDKRIIPESLGIVPGVIYVTSVCLVQLFLSSIFKNSPEKNQILKLFFENNAGIFCSCFMLFLGFADDVLDLRWRYKLFLPAFASIPMLVVYQGSSTILLPKFVYKIIGITSIKLGVFYKIYMLFVAIYCSNAINIYAGINGLETGQSLVIGVSILIYNIIEYNNPKVKDSNSSKNKEHVHSKNIKKLNHIDSILKRKRYHLFSMICILPYIGTTLGLIKYNWYPSKVFVGDTFTYYSGMTLATLGILGHFSKTLMLFFIPQWINFFISVPQLFGIIPCTRHRLPVINETTNLLHPLKGAWNLVNFVLQVCGPMSERNLNYVLMVIQIMASVLAFFIRYKCFNTMFIN